MESLRFITCGSVDDGKSTLIGRLLFDTNSIYEDQKEAIRIASEKRGRKTLDFSFVTDGLKSERARGVTIDVAYRYFSNSTRRFTIIDCPGHEEYTRNMVTGASQADVAVLLVDAEKGLRAQTERHLEITSFLEIRTVFVCVNKLDLFQFSEDRFRQIERDVCSLAERLGCRITNIIPISALGGDSVVRKSERVPWYHGPPLLSALECADPAPTRETEIEPWFNIQYMISAESPSSPDAFTVAGTLVAGRLKTGDRLRDLQTKSIYFVNSLRLGSDDLAEIAAGQAATLELFPEGETTILERGSVLVAKGEVIRSSVRLRVRLCWLSERPLVDGRRFTLHSFAISQSRVQFEPTTETIRTNEITEATLVFARPIHLATRGSAPLRRGILIDELTNQTVAALMFQPD